MTKPDKKDFLGQIASIDETESGLPTQFEKIKENPEIANIAETLKIGNLGQETHRLPDIIRYARKILREDETKRRINIFPTKPLKLNDSQNDDNNLKSVLNYYLRHGIIGLELALSNDEVEQIGISLYKHLNGKSISKEEYPKIRTNFLQSLPDHQEKIIGLYDKFYPVLTAAEGILEDGLEQQQYYQYLNSLSAADILGRLGHIEKRECVLRIRDSQSGQDIYGKDHFKDLKDQRPIICYAAKLMRSNPVDLFKNLLEDTEGKTLDALKKAAVKEIEDLEYFENGLLEKAITRLDFSVVVKGNSLSGIASPYFERFSKDIQGSKDLASKYTVFGKSLPLIEATLLHRDCKTAEGALDKYTKGVAAAFEKADYKKLKDADLKAIEDIVVKMKDIGKKSGKEISPFAPILQVMTEKLGAQKEERFSGIKSALADSPKSSPERPRAAAAVATQVQGTGRTG